MAVTTSRQYVSYRNWRFKFFIIIIIYIYSGVGRCQKVGGGTQTRDLSTFGKEPI